MKPITFGSLFSGAGGLDLGLEQAGMKCTFQVENDKHCLTLLNRHWPDVPKNQIRPCMGLVGGDPCPIRSIPAKRVGGSNVPDMSGYFLAMAARIKPRWILRENVPAPDVVDCAAALEELRYYCRVVEIDSKAFTGQKRRREFVAAFDCIGTVDRFEQSCHDAEGPYRFGEAYGTKEKPLGCLTTHRYRGDTQDGYVYEGQERGLRVLTCAERESLQGFPDGWTVPLSDTQRAKVLGNAVTVPVAKWLGERIAEAMTEK